MSAQNCWTCAHDEQQHYDGVVYHVCGATWSAAVVEWVEAHVAPESPGVPPSMPPRDAPPCPKWAARPNLAESGRMAVESGGDS